MQHRVRLRDSQSRPAGPHLQPLGGMCQEAITNTQATCGSQVPQVRLARRNCDCLRLQVLGRYCHMSRGVHCCKVRACRAHSIPASELLIQNLPSIRKATLRGSCACKWHSEALKSCTPDFAAVARQRLPLLTLCSHQPSVSSLDVLGRSI